MYVYKQVSVCVTTHVQHMTSSHTIDHTIQQHMNIDHYDNDHTTEHVQHSTCVREKGREMNVT